MRYDDLHLCVRNALRRSDVRDFMWADAQTKYLVETVLHPVAVEMEKVLADYGVGTRDRWDIIERVLLAVLPTREDLVARQRAHDELVRQLERGAFNPRAQEGTTDELSTT